MRTFIARTSCRGPGRDQSAGGTRGQHVGTHPAACKFSQDSTGRLSVHSPGGDLVAAYEPATYQTVEDNAGLVHVYRTGDYDPVEAMRIEPKRIADGHPAALRAMNEANDAFWNRRTAEIRNPTSAPAADRAIAAPLVTGSRGDTPQAMQAGLKALNQKLRQHYAA